MSWWPGWDSIEGAGGWSHFWFWFGIACLFALGGAEVISHKYSLRKDALVESRDKEREEQGKRDTEAAEARRKTEVEGLQKQLGEAGKKLSDLQKVTEHRHLLPEQKRTLVEALRPFKGQKVVVTSTMGSDDGQAFARDFMEVFREAQWDIDPGSPSQSIYDKSPVGLEPTLSESETRAGRIPPAFVKLVETLVALNLLPPKTAFMNPAAPPGIIEMRIGIRPGTVK